jgi:hypothetical protein
VRKSEEREAFLRRIANLKLATHICLALATLAAAAAEPLP